MMTEEKDPYIGDLDDVTWDAAKDDFSYGQQEIPKEVRDEFPEIGAQQGGMEREEFDRIVGTDRFSAHVAKLLNWNAKIQGVPEARIDASDQGFNAAMEVVYRRLLDGPGRYLLPYLTNRDLIDLWMVSTWAVPYAIRFRKAIAARKKAARAQAMAQHKAKEPEQKGTDENVN
ncbi:hypothetical protein [Hwanghaeella sp. LZ110]|uniref:hypothetical protein n=1 Tax=Hwanghaeella sp. LZ110 TaxID=3402810 RepID=UPI003B6820E4